MKVGIIFLDSFHDMVGELCAQAIDADLLPIRRESSPGQFWAVAAFLGGARGYDLVHTIGSIVPLSFARFLETPILATIHQAPSDHEIDIFRSAPQNCFFVPAGNLEAIPGLHTAPCADETQQDIGRFYYKIYEQIIRAHVREDHRPWGFYEILSDETADHKVKRITVWPKKRLSLQQHRQRREHWIVVSGQARVTLDQEEVILGPSETVDIPLGAAHRVENIGEGPLVFIEVQQGDYFGEDDIIRLQDDFGRT